MCVYDIKLTNMEKNEEVVSITLGYKKQRMQFYGLSKKTKNARNHCFRFSEIVKITIKTNSSLSKVSICYYLILPIPILHRQIFRIISQDPESVKSL